MAYDSIVYTLEIFKMCRRRCRHSRHRHRRRRRRPSSVPIEFPCKYISTYLRKYQ